MNFTQRAAIMFFVFTLTAGILGAVVQGHSPLAGVIVGVSAYLTVGAICAGIEWSIDGVVGLRRGWIRLLGRD